MRTTAWLLLMPCLGCLSTATVGPVEVVAQDCRGAFEARVAVARKGSRKLTLHYELTPDAYNLDDLQVSPTKETLGRDRDTSEVQVTGRRTNACDDGGVSIFASYPPAGVTGYVQVLATVTPQGDGTHFADASGAFDSTLTLTCCGSQQSIDYAIEVGGEGVRDVVVEPSTFSCVAGDTQDVRIRGVLEAPPKPGTLDLRVAQTDDPTMWCTFEDPVEQGKPEVEATPPAEPSE